MKKNLTEWAVFWVSLGIILSVLGPLIFAAATGNGEPPVIKIETEPPIPQGGQTIVPFVVSNEGKQTAERLLLEATAGDQTSTVEIEYLPRQSIRKGAFIFEGSIQGHVRVRPMGYETP